MSEFLKSDDSARRLRISLSMCYILTSTFESINGEIVFEGLIIDASIMKSI